MLNLEGGADAGAGVKYGNDGDEDDQLDVWCFHETKKSSTKNIKADASTSI